MSSIANSGVRFALGTGDTGYANGTQTNYGDLQQTGPPRELDLRAQLLGAAR